MDRVSIVLMVLPEVIGPYRPLELLGVGGMGQVFLARDAQGRMVAVKTIRPDLAERPDLRARLRREIDTMERIHSPFVAEVLDADAEGPIAYLATRYVSGRSLAEVVDAQGPLRDGDLWVLARGLGQALEAIHTAGCVHRDLKPANVIVVDGEPVVIDFGIAHALGDTRFTVAGQATGTPGYMAPELLVDGVAGTGVDVFAWGATVAFAATSRRADWAQLTAAAIERLLQEARGMPHGLREIVLGALSADPVYRPSAAVLLAGLAEVEPTRGSDLVIELPVTADLAAEGTALQAALPDGRVAVVKVPSGTGEGEVLRLQGKGEDGTHGGPSGDLLCHVVFSEEPPSPDGSAISRPSYEPLVPRPRPPKRRGRRAVTSTLAVGIIAVSGGAWLWIVGPPPGDDGPTTPATTSTVVQSAASASTKPKRPTAEASNVGTDTFETVPSTCSTVPEAVFLKAVPKGEKQQYGGPRQGSCGYESPQGAAFRYLRLETHVASSAQAIDPVGEAHWAFGQDLESQQKDTTATTRKLGPLPGFGEEAFQRFTVDKGDEKTVTARIESRVRNVIVTVSFSQWYDKDPDKLLDTSLETAATVAKEAIHKFS